MYWSESANVLLAALVIYLLWRLDKLDTKFSHYRMREKAREAAWQYDAVERRLKKCE
jgi:hypothetical protein